MMIRKRIWHIFIGLSLFSPIAGAGGVSGLVEREGSPKARAKAPLVRLETMCGPNCLWQIAKAFGKDCTPGQIAEFAGTDAIEGTTVKGMVQACDILGLPAAAIRTSLEKLAVDPRVAILLLKNDDLMHYVVLDTIVDGEVRLLDAAEFREMPVGELKSVWTGVAILVGDQSDRGAGYLGLLPQLAGLAVVTGAIVWYLATHSSRARL